MAAAVGQGQPATTPGQPAPRTDMAPVLQQLNLASLRTRTQDLHNAISRILHSFHNLPSLKWSEVLGQFAMVNVELLNLVEDIKPILKMFVVYPKNVNAENSTILPIMLSSKLLPEMESEEAIMKEQMLVGISNLPVQMQSEKLQRQIETVRAVCDAAEKVLGDARKAYGLSSRQGPVALTTLDKAQAARIAEQEKVLRAASNSGEGLRVSPDQQQALSMLPPHLASALGTSATDLGSSFQRGASSALPPSGLIRPAAPQQTNPAQILQRSNIGAPAQTLGGAVALPGVGAAAATIPYVNSPRSGTGSFNVPSPQQQHQVQQQQQANLLRQQKMQLMQKQQQQQQALQAQVQQNQQLRRPGTPPVPQGQSTMQPQGQQHLLQLQQQAKMQQQQNQLLQQQQQQQLQQYQDKHSLQQLQAQQQQQTLQQQLQNTQLQAAQQSALSQGNQGRSQLNQLAGMNSMYGNTQSSLLPSNTMMGNMTQPGQSQTALLQQRYLQGNASQLYSMSNNLGNNMANMGNTIGNTVGNIGMAGTGAQATSTLALPLQQQLAGQANYSGLFNANQNNAFGQQRQQPPPQ